jgi:RNA polymerase sigma factor (sigma-70 family)
MDDDLVKKYGEKLERRLSNYLHRKNCNQPGAHVKGVCNHTWINALSHLGDLRDWAKFEAWLLSIGRREANRHLKLCIRQQNGQAEFPDESPSPRAELAGYYKSRDAAIDVDRILTYLESISEELASIFRLRYEQDLGFDQIAEILGSTKANIRNKHYRALAKIRARFFNEETDTPAENSDETPESEQNDRVMKKTQP